MYCYLEPREKQFLENASKAFLDDVSSKEQQKELKKLKKV